MPKFKLRHFEYFLNNMLKLILYYSNGHNNGDSTNGRNGNDEAASTDQRGRRNNSRRNNAASRDREPSESSEEPRTTRSSARLRSSRKWTKSWEFFQDLPLVQFCKWEYFDPLNVCKIEFIGLINTFGIPRINPITKYIHKTKEVWKPF